MTTPTVTLAKIGTPRTFDDIQGYHQCAITLARRAGNLIKQHRYPATANSESSLELNTKASSADLVTNADIASQNLIFSALKEKYPKHKFIGEEDEEKSRLTDSLTWVVDAIDGTTNYVHGLSDCCVSIALVENRKPIVGAIYNPFKNEMFHAIRNRGAFLNDEPLFVKPCDSLHDALVLTEWVCQRFQKG